MKVFLLCLRKIVKTDYGLLLLSDLTSSFSVSDVLGAFCVRQKVHGFNFQPGAEAGDRLLLQLAQF